MKTVYFDCFAGIAGDMTVAALLDLGVPLAYLEERLALLPLDPSSYRIAAETVARRGIRATHLWVDVSHQHHHRHYRDIAMMIEHSSLFPGEKERLREFFRRLAEAEATVHGVEVDQVHFHEVGAVDSIIDIVGTAVCLEYLKIAAIYASPLPYGSGYVETAHGRLPVPAPATAELMRGMPVHFGTGPGERVTPTGAAILTALADGFGAPPVMRVEGIGCGAGTKDFEDLPNVLRLVLGEQAAAGQRDSVYVIETHVDDMNPRNTRFPHGTAACRGRVGCLLFSPSDEKKPAGGQADSTGTPGGIGEDSPG